MAVDVGLSPAQRLLIAAAQGVASILSEVPAGVVADTFGRKKAIVASHVLMATAMAVTGLFPSFVPLMPAQMLWGVSWTGDLRHRGLALAAAQRRLDSDGGARTFLAFPVSLVLLDLASSLPLGVAAVITTKGIAMPLVRTVTTIWVNRHTDSDIRATTHSFLTQAEYAGEILCAAPSPPLPGPSEPEAPCSSPRHSSRPAQGPSPSTGRERKARAKGCHPRGKEPADGRGR
ncbi:hypothetical protein [Nonomuraea sp. NPDC050786]|uniref:hypothetical protein n=1 Tax=Nonomuraea sp. NPDC050786 TaxID=3154840 RepID=UPI0033E3DA9D